MPTWFIEPRDPLIVRDGRPFGPDPGARARSLSFPMPSTTTGGLRNRAGVDAHGAFDTAKIADVLKIAVRGPLLASLTEDGEFQQWLLPAPADALLLKVEYDENQAQIVRLQPLKKPEGVSYSTLHDDAELALVGPTQAVSEKPFSKSPQFWHWAQFTSWLLTPTERTLATADLGISGPQPESRTHVSIQAATQTAEDGRLFQTNGLEFTDSSRQRLALVVACDQEFTPFQGGFAPLGGERRLMAWRKAEHGLPECSDVIRQRIKAERACRVILLTPAHFAAGYRPTWLLDTHGGVRAELVAALVQRPQVISGWDIKEGKPKPTRRLAPAGSVFFLRFPETATETQLNDWINAIWMQNISDDAPDRLDGFGLAILGTWDGKLRAMEVE